MQYTYENQISQYEIAPNEGNRSAGVQRSSANGDLTADGGTPCTLNAWSTPSSFTAGKAHAPKLALPRINPENPLDSSLLVPAVAVDRISSEIARKYPISDDQNTVHRSAIGKIENRKRITERVSHLMDEIGEPARAEKMRMCGQFYTLRDYGNRVRHGGMYFCGQRSCAICAHRRSMRLLATYRTILNKFGLGRFAYHIVLTYKNEEKPVERCKISKHIKNFTRRKFLAEYGYAGGLYSVEATYNKADAMFHTHVHMLVYTERPIPTIDHGKEENRGRFQNSVNQEMAENWHKVTKNSFIVYGGKLRGGLFEMVKYISKFTSCDDGSVGLQDLPAEKFKELFDWMTGSRFITAIGGLYGKIKEQKWEDAEEEFSGSMDTDEPIEAELAELTADMGNEGYTEYLYAFKPNLNRYVIVEERRYDPIISRTSMQLIHTE